MVEQAESAWFLKQLTHTPVSTVEALAARRDGATILGDVLANTSEEARGGIVVIIALRDRVDKGIGDGIARFLNEAYRLVGRSQLRRVFWASWAGVIGAVGLAVAIAILSNSSLNWLIGLIAFLLCIVSIIWIIQLWPAFSVHRFFSSILGQQEEGQKWVRNLKITSATYPLLLLILPWLGTVAHHRTGQKASVEVPRLASSVDRQVRIDAADGSGMVFVPARDFAVGRSDDEITYAYQASEAINGNSPQRPECERGWKDNAFGNVEWAFVAWRPNRGMENDHTEARPRGSWFDRLYKRGATS